MFFAPFCDRKSEDVFPLPALDRVKVSVS